MNKEIAISVKNVSKTFKIPHEKVSSVRGAVTGIFRDKSYEEFKALDDISFEVKKGEFFGIIGRNGSGKSTLLKVLAGIYQADKGKVKINGMISPFLELGIGFNPELSGRDNVYLNATVLGMTKDQIDEKFESIVKFSELERFIDQKLKNYSSGMQVRLAFSVSIHANRDILLMDEVLAVGDSNFQQKCLDQFNKLKEQGKTIILVSHAQASVEEYCDRVIMLKNGKIMREGSPLNVFAFYNTSLLNSNETIFRDEDNITQKVKNTLKIGNENEIFYENDKRWGNFMIRVEEMVFIKSGRVFSTQDNISGNIKIKIQKRIKSMFNVDLSLAMYNVKDTLIFLDKIVLKDNKDDYINVPFSFKVNELVDGLYRFTLRIAHKDVDKNGIVYDHWDKDNQIRIKNNNSKYPGILNIGSVFKKDIKIIGMIRMRNESLILQDTLDSFAKIVDGIIIYDDASTDNSVDIARKHKAVLNVIENKIWKKDRLSEETENRQILLEYAQHYDPEWIFYADCDERFDNGIREFLLSNESKNIDGIRIQLFDAYITLDDQNPYSNGPLWCFRKMFGPERRDILMIWRNKRSVRYIGLDKREPDGVDNIITMFHCQHYGKALSSEHWEETCDYYINNFPDPYREKWLKRKGKFLHSVSDFGRELYDWNNVKRNAIKIN